MKKLLSLLSVLTISGTAIPTTIAASPYQNEKTMENSDSYINYQQINNLENLIRNKREDLGLSVVSVVDKILGFGVILDNKLYFGTDGSKVYEYDLITNQKKVVINTDNSNTWVRGIGLTWNNKIYFAADDGKIYEYNPATQRQRTIVSVVDKILGFGVILDNKLYFGTDGSKVYEYDLITNQKKVVINTDNSNTWVRGIGLTWNNKIYFAADDGKIYEYNIPKYNLNNFIKTTNLQHIENNNNNAILNELNYLNAGLDISQLEVINKTNTSAIIKPKSDSNKYFGEKKIYYMMQIVIAIRIFQAFINKIITLF